jgi:hypothetical protein
MMPQSSQNLYFHLGMNADDDGFCEHFTIMRMTESKPDDLKILQAKGFVNVFDDKVLVVLDWKENNFIRSDRYKPSKYLEIYKTELLNISKNKERLSSGIPNDDQRDTQVRLGKDRLEYNNSEPSSPNIKDLYYKMGLPKPVRQVNLWQDEAANAVKYFNDGEDKRSSVFKCFKDNQQKARIAFSDCKELNKKSVLYFLKVFSEISKK